MTAAG
jgi:hypothetical protein